MKKAFSLMLILAMALTLLTGCGDIEIGGPASGDTPASAPDSSNARVIELKGSHAESKSGGVSVNGSTVTIGAGGTYTVSGKLDDGQIVINTGDDPTDVVLILDNADITCLTDAAIYVRQAKNVDIQLPAGTANRIVSGTEADMAKCDETSTGAAIRAEDDLDIKGEGSLEVCGYINSGITCKDDIDIQGGTVTVVAANNGIKGNESVEISGCVLSVTAGNDGIKSTCIDKEGKGYVAVSGGTVSILSTGGDGISAATGLTVSGGTVSIETQGDAELVSSKGLKSDGAVTISDCEITVNSTDHALRSGAGIDILSGSLCLNSTVGKAINAQSDVNISGGTLLLTSTDDGIASVTAVNISGGEIQVTAGNDGIKAGEKANGFNAATGSFVMTGGSVTVCAMADPVDARAEARVDGGTLAAVGFSKSLKALSAGAQPSISASVTAAAGAQLDLKDEAGNVILSVASVYKVNSVLLSGGLTSGQTYKLSSPGGTVTVTAA